MQKILFWILACFFSYSATYAQELQARLTVNVNKDKVGTQVDRKVFQTLQTTLTNFINNRKWTTDVFQTNEKILCNFLLNINEVSDQNIFKATLTVQAARPAFNTVYQSPLINFIDDDIIFRYQEFQPIEFNENRIQGNDPLASNLSAVLAYWAYMILGFDYGSFNVRGGDPYFLKAQNIVNNAPERQGITGWKNYEGMRNRFWLSENLNNNRFALIHDAIYSYYKTGIDIFYENEEEGRNGIYNSLSFISSLDAANPNSMVVQFFFQGKSTELVNVFNRADRNMKDRALDLLLKLDITNARAYSGLK